MLAKRYRLRKNYQYNYIYKKGKSIANKYLVLFYCRRRDKGINIGFSVSNKLGKAVVRNKIKRRLREAVKQNFHTLDAGRNYVFLTRQPIKELDYTQIEKAVINVISRIRQDGEQK